MSATFLDYLRGLAAAHPCGGGLNSRQAKEILDVIHAAKLVLEGMDPRGQQTLREAIDAIEKSP